MKKGANSRRLESENFENEIIEASKNYDDLIITVTLKKSFASAFRIKALREGVDCSELASRLLESLLSKGNTVTAE